MRAFLCLDCTLASCYRFRFAAQDSIGLARAKAAVTSDALRCARFWAVCLIRGSRLFIVDLGERVHVDWLVAGSYHLDGP